MRGLPPGPPAADDAELGMPGEWTDATDKDQRTPALEGRRNPAAAFRRVDEQIPPRRYTPSTNSKTGPAANAKSLILWWASRESNTAPTDYESVQWYFLFPMPKEKYTITY